MEGKGLKTSSAAPRRRPRQEPAAGVEPNCDQDVELRSRASSHGPGGRG